MAVLKILATVVCLSAILMGAFAEDAGSPKRLDSAKFMESRDVREGMTGYGLTVFHGTKIERFEVEILGVISNEYSETNLILGRVTGGPLAKTGVIAGMSGSPIYIDNKLIGALAYAWPYSTDAIAGITPIENMLPVMDMPPTERREPGEDIKKESMSPPISGHESFSETNSTPSNWEDRLAAFIRKDYSAALTGLPRSDAEEAGLQSAALNGHSLDSLADWWQSPWRSINQAAGKAGWLPLATPLSMGGISRQTYDELSSLFSATGFQPVVGGAVGSASGEKVKLEPGSALGVAMVTGDLNMTGIGTVTHVDGNKVIGFGHPMFQDGPTDLPMTTAYINVVLPSSRLSTKMGGIIEVIGALEQDRLPAVGGTVGEKPTLVPFKVHIQNPRAGINRHFQYDVALHRFFTSRFGMICILDAFDAATRGMRDSASDYTLRIKMKNQPEVVLRDQVSSSGGTSFDIAMTFASVLDLLMLNPYEKFTLEELSLDVKTIDRLERGSIDWIAADGEAYKAGQDIQVRIAWRPWLGQQQILQHSLTIPPTFTRGQVQLTVSDANAYIGEMQRRNPDRFRPRNAADLITLLNEVYRNDSVFLTLSAIAPGVSMNGREMSNLPSSILRVMANSAEDGTGMYLMNKPLMKDSVSVGIPLSGSHSLVMDVEPNREPRIN